MSDKCTELESTCDNFSTENKELLKDISSIEEKLANSTKKVTGQDIIIDQLKETNSDLKSNNDHLDARIAHLESENSQMNRTIHHLESE